MNVDEVLAELKAKGSASTARIFRSHGAPDPIDGVKVGDLKLILKRTGPDHALALDLWRTGHADAQYLAGLMVQPKRMTEEDLQSWADTARWYMLSEYSVAWVGAESGRGWEMGRRWIDAPREPVAAAGWSALASHVALTADADLDLPAVDALLSRVTATLSREQNRVRYAMNAFVIAVGTYVTPLLSRALEVAAAVGEVKVDLGGTACKVPEAAAYIHKARERTQGKKRRSVRC